MSSNTTGKIISITNKLDRAPKFIELDGETYKVDCGKNTVIRFMEIQNRIENNELNDIEAIDESIKLFLGKDVFLRIEENHPDFDFDCWKTIFFACVSAAMNRDLEEVENSFRNASQGAK